MSTQPTSTTASSDRSNHFLEFELICHCARLHVDPSAVRRIDTLIRQDVDWNFLIVAAHQHRVLPLLHRSLTRVAADNVPDDALRRLQTACHTNARRSLLLTRELLRLLDIFRTHEISCIPYKGPVLAWQVYRDISLRQFCDLDVILPEHDVIRARALLLADGYRPGTEMTATQLRDFIARERDLTLYQDDIGFELELHWRVTRDWHAIQIPSQTVWERLDTCSIAGRSVATHTFEDLLVILCTHGAMHGWDRLGWLCDVAEIVRSRPDLNWSLAFERADAVDGRRILLLGLALAADLLGADLPVDVIQAIHADGPLKPLTEQVKIWLRSDTPVPLGERERFFVGLREHTADRVRVGMQQAKKYLAPTSRDAESFPLPVFLTRVLYLLRPIRLAREYGLKPIVRLIRGLFPS